MAICRLRRTGNRLTSSLVLKLGNRCDVSVVIDQLTIRHVQHGQYVAGREHVCFKDGVADGAGAGQARLVAGTVHTWAPKTGTCTAKSWLRSIIVKLAFNNQCSHSHTLTGGALTVVVVSVEQASVRAASAPNQWVVLVVTRSIDRPIVTRQKLLSSNR